MAQAFDVAMGHHEEPQVAAHLLASIPHGTFVECFHPDRDPIWWNLVANRPPLVDGRLQLTDAPGLGWELDPEYIEHHRVPRRLGSAREDHGAGAGPATGAMREVAAARGRGDVLRLARALGPPGREPGDARARHGGRRRLGYEPDLLAQSLRRRATQHRRLRGRRHLEPAARRDRARRGDDAAAGAGYSMLLTNSENDPERDARHARLLLQRRVDGLLLSLAAEDDPGRSRTLEQMRTSRSC